MDTNSKIYIAGHQGMVGKNLHNRLLSDGYSNLLTIPFNNLDLRKQKDTADFIDNEKPDYIFLIAGKVGGIHANIQFPGEYLYDNLMIAANVIEAARNTNVKKLLFIGSSCIYPRLSPQPMKEEYLLTGKLEGTNEGYAIGKIAGLKLCEYYNKQYGSNFISVMPPNLYGPGDNFSNEYSHVISALIQRFYRAKLYNSKNLTLWGTGTARREFLYNEDAVDGLIYLMRNYNESSHINMGTGVDVSIKELANLIKDIVGFEGEILWDSDMPDGMPKKMMDSSRIFEMGWNPQVKLEEGLKNTYKWYLENHEKI